MWFQLKEGVRKVRDAIAGMWVRKGAGETLAMDATATAAVAGPGLVERTRHALWRWKMPLLLVGLVGAVGWQVYREPPLATIARGELGVRHNRLTGDTAMLEEGIALVLPLVHDLRVFPLRDQTYRPEALQSANGPAPLQSREGLSFGLDISVRYGLDRARLKQAAEKLPNDIAGEIVEPAVHGLVYKLLAQYTVREVFSTKRGEIQQQLEAELARRLTADGIVLKGVAIGKIDLPADYKRGMESLLAEELASEKMRYTLDLKGKRVKESELDAEAEKVRREKVAEALAREQVIAARAQEESMKHVLPFKQRQIEQRQLEAEAEKQSRVRGAEATAQARRIEATGEAEARQKLADAEAYRLEKLGKVNAEQMAREGALVTNHPLLIQKALADKLGDKIQVIIAPPSETGFIAANLVGQGKK